MLEKGEKFGTNDGMEKCKIRADMPAKIAKI